MNLESILERLELNPDKLAFTGCTEMAFKTSLDLDLGGIWAQGVLPDSAAVSQKGNMV